MADLGELKTRSSPPSSPSRQHQSTPSYAATRQTLAELRRLARTLVARLQPYLPQVVMLLLAALCLAVFLPLPKANPISSAAHSQTAIPANGSFGESGEGKPALVSSATPPAASPAREGVQGQPVLERMEAAGSRGGEEDQGEGRGSEEADFALVSGLAAKCREKPQQGYLKWGPLEAAGSPEAQRFLVLDCFRGQMNKHLICLGNHILLAGLLNRTLLVPKFLPDFRHQTRMLDLDVAFDVGHIRACLGNDTVMHSSEYVSKFGAESVPLHLLHCWHGPRGACGQASRRKQGNRASPWEVTWTCPASVDGEKGRDQLLAGGNYLLLPLRLNPPFFTDPLVNATQETPTKAACLPLHSPLDHVMSVYRGLEEKVIAVGDLGEHRITDSPELSKAGEQPFVRAPGCPNTLIVSPPAVLLRLAEEIVGSLFPDNLPFLAVHWLALPSHLGPCLRSELKGRCFYRMNQAAFCTSEEVRKRNLWNVYVARGGMKSKMEEFRDSIRRYSDGRALVSHLPDDAVMETAAKAIAKELPGIDVVQQRLLIIATLDKLVAARAAVFIGSPESSFSIDVQRMRNGLGVSSCSDGTLCRGADEWDPLRVR